MSPKAAWIATLCMVAAFVPGHAGARNGSYGQNPLQGFSSDNVEWIANVPIAAPVASSVVGDYLYVTNQRHFYVYDVRDADSPRQIGALPLDAAPEIPYSHMTSDGRVAVVGQTTPVDEPPWPRPDNPEAATRVIDVTEEDRPRLLASVRTLVEPSWTCILGCNWAYGAQSGQILDLRDPRRPRLLRRPWDRELRGQGTGALINTYHLAEVRDGVVLTGTDPMYLLDARANPARPKVIGVSDGSPYSLGGVAWPARGRSRYILSFNVIGGLAPHCALAQRDSTFENAFATWDARPWSRGDGLIHPVDTHYLENGHFVDGDPPVSLGLGGCMFTSLDTHPGYPKTGLVGVTAAAHGVKFLRIGARGEIREAGWFLPHRTSAWQGHWVDDEFFYSMDYNRGIDILRFEETD